MQGMSYKFHIEKSLISIPWQACGKIHFIQALMFYLGGLFQNQVEMFLPRFLLKD